MQQDMASQIDLRGLIGPITLLMVMQAFRRLNRGETLEIVGSDVQTRKDLFKVLDGSCYELVSFQDDMTCYRVLLRKRR